MKGYQIFLIFLILLIACDGNYKDVVITGHVTDSISGNAIPHSKIVVTCWVYDTKIWESRKVVKDTISSASGDFIIHFEKAEAIDVKVEQENYQPKIYSMTLKKNNSDIAVRLKRIK
jgi:hypothetical protein